jgi:GNAT superfamily N-acetyltransferase
MTDIRPLRPEDDRPGFASGQADLDRFFRETAGQHQFKRHLSVTYVAEVDGQLAGFVTLCAGTMAAEAMGFEVRRWPQQPLPILRLARLATDQRHVGKGVGGALTRFAMHQSIEMRDRYGCVALVVDAKPDAVNFYLRLGFVAISVVAPPPGDPTLMLITTDTLARAIGGTGPKTTP